MAHVAIFVPVVVSMSFTHRTCISIYDIIIIIAYLILSVCQLNHMAHQVV